jgi:hypothetical protein
VHYKKFVTFFKSAGLLKHGFGINVQTTPKTLKMKKVFSIIAVALMVTFVACGPSAEEKEKIEAQAKATADSIQKALEASMAASTPEAGADSTKADTTAAKPAEEAKH